MHARSGAWRCCDGKGRGARVQCELLLAATFIICWTLNLHWFVLLGSSKKFTSRDHWITALSQINGCYSSRCLSCPRKALHWWAIWRLQSANVCEAAPNTQLKQLLAGEKIYLSSRKNRQISTSLCSKSVKTFLSIYLCTLHWFAFTNALP